MFQVIRDTREQKGWTFDESPSCAGTVVKTLKTGDYTIEGLSLCIERKGSVSELATNVFQKRFENELIRMGEYKHKLIICEFELKDVISYPYNLPPNLRSKVKLNGAALLRRINELEINYDIPFKFCGKQAKTYILSYMKRIYERYQKA